MKKTNSQPMTKAEILAFVTRQLKAGNKHPRYLNRFKELSGKEWEVPTKKSKSVSPVITPGAQELIDANPQLEGIQIIGTGSKGNVIKKDVKEALKKLKEN